MKYIHRLLFISALLTAPVAIADSVLDISDSSRQPSLIMPQSFETDTHKMLEDWYLKNYTVLDYEADRDGGTPLNDEVILDRLSRMPTIIEMPLNTPVRNAINFYANRKKQLVENMLGLSLYYMPIFEEALERHGLPQELRYLPVIESALVPTAVSRAGAAGLWQFMSPTAKDLGLEVNSLVDQRRDPYLSSEAGARYLKQLFNTYGDWSLAIAAYNCGPGNVNKALRRAGDGKHDFWEIYPFLPAETRNYVPAFIAANYIMNYYKEHDISPALARKPLIVDTVHVSRRVHFEQISDVMGIPVAEIRALNPQFRADIIPGDIHPYSLVLPSLQVYAYVANEDSIVNHNAQKYARRGIVEPATGRIVGGDANGEYYDEEVILYHKVKKGETLSKIAKKYGVTVGSIRRLNKVGKSVKAGKKLKIKTVQRRYRPAPKPQPAEQNNEVQTSGSTTSNDSISPVPDKTAANADTTLTRESAAPEAPVTGKGTVKADSSAEEQQHKASNVGEKKNNKKSSQKTETKKKQKEKTVTHKVRKGENLGKIARRYGVTVDALRKANKIKGDRIDIGQILTIPSK
ncbi:MAG: transglycosylase SLT domain-containing protein [Muribaculaceae bacterium]|nr:transglycosylase SLT domain-containing protein [Muribaculaceae bacterium]